jgi:hypothetical protein
MPGTLSQPKAPVIKEAFVSRFDAQGSQKTPQIFFRRDPIRKLTTWVYLM